MWLALNSNFLDIYTNPPWPVIERSIRFQNTSRVMADVTVRSTFGQIFSVTDVISQAPNDITFIPRENVRIKAGNRFACLILDLNRICMSD